MENEARADQFIDALNAFDTACVDPERIDDGFQALANACEAWCESVQADIARRPESCPDAAFIRDYLSAMPEFVRTALLPRLLSVARRNVSNAVITEQKVPGKTYVKVSEAVRERVDTGRDAVHDLYERLFDPDPSIELTMATPAARGIIVARNEWAALVAAVRAATASDDVPSGQEIAFMFSEALDPVDRESATWPEVAAELADVCGETVDLLLAAVDIVATVHDQPLRPDLRLQLDAQDKLLTDAFQLQLDYLLGVWLKQADDKKKNPRAADELAEFEAKYHELMEDLTVALQEQDGEEASDITSGIYDLTLSVLSAAEALSLNLAPDAKGELIEKIEKLFLLTERQASNSQALVANPNNPIASRRLERLNVELRKAISEAIGAMIRGRDGITDGVWIDAFNDWRMHVTDQRQLTAEIHQIEAGGENKSGSTLTELQAELAAAVAGRAPARDRWLAEAQRRSAVDRLKLEHEQEDRQLARDSRRAEYEKKTAHITRDRLRLEKEEKDEALEELARQERARLRELELKRLEEEEAAERVRQQQEAEERRIREAQEAEELRIREEQEAEERRIREQQEAEEAQRLAEERAAQEEEAAQQADEPDELDAADLGDDEQADTQPEPEPDAAPEQTRDDTEAAEDATRTPSTMSHTTTPETSPRMLQSASDPGPLKRQSSRVRLDHIDLPARDPPSQRASLTRQSSRIVLESLPAPPTPQ